MNTALSIIFILAAVANLYHLFRLSVTIGVNRIMKKELEEGSFFTRYENITKELKKVA
jgi:hypothetical protein